MRLPTQINGPVAVIGDVHGQIDLLESLLEQLHERPDFDDRWLVSLAIWWIADPDPKATIDTILSLMQERGRVAVVAGNHDLAMAGALGLVPTVEEANWVSRWVKSYDSHTTFHSYGVEHGDLAALAAALPPEHEQLLTKLPWCVEHPELPVCACRARGHLLWIRNCESCGTATSRSPSHRGCAPGH